MSKTWCCLDKNQKLIKMTLSHFWKENVRKRQVRTLIFEIRSVIP